MALFVNLYNHITVNTRGKMDKMEGKVKSDIRYRVEEYGAQRKSKQQSRELVGAFIDRFVDTESRYYKNVYSRDPFHAFLWDCLVDERWRWLAEEQALIMLRQLPKVYFFWERAASSILYLDEDDFVYEDYMDNLENYLKDLPKDLYIVDHTFTFAAARSHEYMEFGENWIIVDLR
ncbi:hypothetical protein [Paenibacillus turpanensis]|uniref:hypothetical protein n=1 Tax=Paenibacillus turpanensis TaxID=2689078 RepID=UPI00140A49EB|nr:hypothetical protein [Paenibacillus turpanensis]